MALTGRSGGDRDEAKAAWEKARRRGKWHYALVRGASYAVVFTAVLWLVSRLLNRQPPDDSFTWLFLPAGFVIGTMIALLSWEKGEEKYGGRH